LLYNINRGKNKATTPASFFPSLEDEKPAEQEVMTDEQIANFLKLMFPKKE